jgi:thiol-disulfide isomerase/thioredoxin
LIVAAVGMALCAPLSAQKIQNLNQRVPAPSLSGGEWLNTSGPLRLADLRGKFVILDFWTYCCINCMHILPELKKLEHAYPNELVVIGVHSPKFATERVVENVREAIVREKIEHPVVNDPDKVIWRRFEADVWPSLRFIDPEGNVIAISKGEITFATLDRFMKSQVSRYRRVLDRTPLRFDLEKNRVEPTPLRFPGKVLADEASGRLFISDTYHNRIVVTSLDGKLIGLIGSGATGSRDGPLAQATFDHPQGIALRGDHLYVADTENHMIRKVDLKEGVVETIAGTGKQRRAQEVRSSSRLKSMQLASPWDLLIHGERLYIAMAGTHQIWTMDLNEKRIGPFAGNATEDIVDGPLLSRAAFAPGSSSFAQPSGLATDGEWLFVADSEGSSIRAVPFDATKRVLTVLGTARLAKDRLFTFGDRDGSIRTALLQHPLGVAYRDGRLFVADTYNNKIKVIDVQAGKISTVAGGGAADAKEFNEPSGLSIAAGKLFVADTNAHRIRVIPLAGDGQIENLAIAGLEPPEALPPDPVAVPGAQNKTLKAVSVKPADGSIRFRVQLTLPPQFKWNETAFRCRLQVAGDSTVFKSDQIPELAEGFDQPSMSEFEVELPLGLASGEDRVRFQVTYFYCQQGLESLCRIGQVSWTGKVVVAADGEEEAVLLTHRVRTP